jgi:hypothetical protein
MMLWRNEGENGPNFENTLSAEFTGVGTVSNRRRKASKAVRAEKRGGRAGYLKGSSKRLPFVSRRVDTSLRLTDHLAAVNGSAD